MKKILKYQPARRATVVVLVLITLVGGVAFAAILSLTNTITGSTIRTATSNMQVSIDNGQTYSTTVGGFDFSNLIPGGPAVPAGNGYTFRLKNTGSIPLTVKLSIDGMPVNPSELDLSKVNIILTPLADSGATTEASPQSFTLADLVDADTAGTLTVNMPTPLSPGSNQRFGIQVSLAPDIVVSQNAAIGSIDLALTGVGQP